RVHDQTDLAVLDMVYDVGTAFRDFIDRLDLDAVVLKIRRRAPGGVEQKPQPAQAARHLRRRGLVVVFHAQHDPPGARGRDPRGLTSSTYRWPPRTANLAFINPTTPNSMASAAVWRRISATMSPSKV